MRTSIALITTLSMTVLAGGCASPPSEQIDAAQSSLESAGAGAATEYAPDSYAAAQTAMQSLQAELAAQDQKFAMFRSYDRAGELATAARTAAEDALREASDEKQRVREEATELIADAQAVLQEATLLLSQAPGGKGTEADLEALRADLDLVATELLSAETGLDTERYREAQAHAGSAHQIASRVKSSIEQAIQSTRRRG